MTRADPQPPRSIDKRADILALDSFLRALPEGHVPSRRDAETWGRPLLDSLREHGMSYGGYRRHLGALLCWVTDWHEEGGPWPPAENELKAANELLSFIVGYLNNWELGKG